MGPIMEGIIKVKLGLLYDSEEEEEEHDSD